MLLILDLAIVGGLIAVGVNNFNHLWRRFFKFLIVLGLIGAANVYQSDFVTAVTSLPAWLSQGIISGSATGPAWRLGRCGLCLSSARCIRHGRKCRGEQKCS